MGGKGVGWAVGFRVWDMGMVVWLRCVLIGGFEAVELFFF